MPRAFVLIQTEIGKIPQVVEQLSNIEGVQVARPVEGPYDVVVETKVMNSSDELGQMVIREIQAIAGITRTLTCPVVKL